MRTTLIHWVEGGSITTGADVPVVCQSHAGFIKCPHCGNEKASVLSDLEDGHYNTMWRTDCGECDHNQHVYVIELNKYAYAYLKSINFNCIEQVVSWGSHYSMIKSQIAKDRATLKEILMDDQRLDGFDMEYLFGDGWRNEFGMTQSIEMTYDGVFYHGYRGDVPTEVIAEGKDAVRIWLTEHGEPMPYDYDAFDNVRFNGKKDVE